MQRPSSCFYIGSAALCVTHQAWEDAAEVVADDADDGADAEKDAEHRHSPQSVVVEDVMAVAGDRGVLGGDVGVHAKHDDALCPS